jgi:hypothetical protein
MYRQAFASGHRLGDGRAQSWGLVVGAAVQYSLLLTHSPQLTHSVDPPSKSEKLLGLQPFDLRRDDDPGVILICFSKFPDFQLDARATRWA